MEDLLSGFSHLRVKRTKEGSITINNPWRPWKLRGAQSERDQLLNRLHKPYPCVLALLNQELLREVSTAGLLQAFDKDGGALDGISGMALGLFRIDCRSDELVDLCSRWNLGGWALFFLEENLEKLPRLWQYRLDVESEVRRCMTDLRANAVLLSWEDNIEWSLYV